MINSCYICNSKNLSTVDTKIRRTNIDKDIKIKVMKCNNCTFQFLSNQAHVEDDFYEDSKMFNSERFINEPDNDYLKKFKAWSKSTKADNDRRFNYLVNSITNKSLLDYGCGAGEFLKRAHNLTSRAIGVEVDRDLYSYLSSALKTEGLSFERDIQNLKDSQKFDIITCFHVLEHVKDPVSEIKKMKNYLSDTGEIIIEVPNVNDALLTFYNVKKFRDWYYWSCHLYYYNERTLRMIAEKAGMNVDYIKQIQRFPLSNHLHWLNKKLPNGHKVYDCINSESLNSQYAKTLSSISACDTLLMRLSKK